MSTSIFNTLSPENAIGFRRAMGRFAGKGFDISIQDDRLHLEAPTAAFSYDEPLPLYSSIDWVPVLSKFITTAFCKFAFQTSCPESTDVLDRYRANEFIVWREELYEIEGDASYCYKEGFELDLSVGVHGDDHFTLKKSFSSWPTNCEIKSCLEDLIKNYTKWVIFIDYLEKEKNLKGNVANNFVAVIDHRMAVTVKEREYKTRFDDVLSREELQKATLLWDDFAAYEAKLRNDLKAEVQAEPPLESGGLDLV